MVSAPGSNSSSDLEEVVGIVRGSDGREEPLPWMGEGEGGDGNDGGGKDHELMSSRRKKSGGDGGDSSYMAKAKTVKGRLGLASDPEELQAELREFETGISGSNAQGEMVEMEEENSLYMSVKEESEIGHTFDCWWLEGAEEDDEYGEVTEGGGEEVEVNDVGGPDTGKLELPFVPLDPAWEPSDVETRRSGLEARLREVEHQEGREDLDRTVGQSGLRGWAGLYRKGGEIDMLASTWRAHLENHGWNLGTALKSLGKRYQGPHLDKDRISALLRGVKDGLDVVREIEQGGVQVPLKQDLDGKIRRQDLPARISYGCHKSARTYSTHVDKKVVTDIVKGWAFVVPKSCWALIPNLCISPVGAVCQKEKVRVVHDLTFSLNYDTSLNDMVCKERLPECDIGSVLNRFAEKAYGWRMLFPHEHLVVRTIDVVDAFRTKMVAPQDMAKFSYVWRDYIVIDTRLQFGYCGAPGHFQRHSNAMTQAHNITRWDDPRINSSYIDVPIMEHLKVEEGWTSDKILAMPSDKEKLSRARYEYEATREIIADASIYIDDMIQLQVNQGDRLLRSAANSVRVNYEALGLPGQDGQGPLGLKKFGAWSSIGTLLGICVDLNKMLFSLPQSKLEKLRRILFDQFPRVRTTATLKEIQSLVGTCRSYAFCIRPGRYFLRRMINVTIGKGGEGKHSHRTINLDEEFHRDMDWWRDIYLHHEKDPDSYSLPIWAHVKVRPDLVVIGDSSGHAGGGVVLGLDIWFRYDWPEEVVQRLNETNAGTLMEASEKTTIAHLELAIMVLGIGVMIENMRTTQPLPVLALCDNANAVSWHRKAGARCPKASELIRILGELETRHKVYLNSRHLAGIDNTLADEISGRSWQGAAEYMEKGGRALVKEEGWFKDGESDQVMLTSSGLTCANHKSWNYAMIPQGLWNRVLNCLLGTISGTLSPNRL